MDNIEKAKQAVNRRKKELEFKSFSKELRKKLESLGLGPDSVGKVTRRLCGRITIK